MPLLPLRGRKVVERVRAKGQRFRGTHLQARILFGHPRTQQGSTKNQADMMYLGVTASLHLNKSAVKRNRMRRRCREALRTILQTYDHHKTIPSCQLIITPRSSSLSCDFEELQEDAKRLLRFLRSSRT